jgi:menaquinone-9 beta-reductase
MSGPARIDHGHEVHDLVIVGAGPAGAATALGALAVDPRLRVLLVDRAEFPRDKACGDGVAPHVLDVLAEVGVSGLLDDRVPVGRLRLVRGGLDVQRDMHRPAYVVPRAVLDARLVEAAQAAGATLVRGRVRNLDTTRPDTVGLRLATGSTRARVVVGADGAHSLVRRALGRPSGPMALAVRGYAPVPPGRARTQVIAFGTVRQPAYAWSFDRGDGLANVGYGEPLNGGRIGATKAQLVERLDELLPGASAGGTDWVGHHLPLSTARWAPPAGRVLLVGDAAGLVNPLTGEGIYYAVATGVAAGRAAARALAEGDPSDAGRRFRVATSPLLSWHLRHTAAAAALCRHGRVLDAGLRASAGDQRVFDDLVELGLARGHLTPRLTRGLARGLLGSRGTAARTAPGPAGPSDTRDTVVPTPAPPTAPPEER